MKDSGTISNVIHLSRPPGSSMGENRTLGASSQKDSNTRVIAVTSGKGGVGKTNIVANLGFGLARAGKKVLILDADLGLGNIDVLLGLAPKYNLSHVIGGAKTLSEVIVDGPGDMKILPASSGIQELANLSRSQQFRMISELDRVIDSVDYLLIDTAAGISSNVIYFNVTAREVMIVVTPEPTSVTDAYALMKVLSVKYPLRYFKVLVNLAGSMREGYEVFRQLKMVADRFLNVNIEYFGSILFDEKMQKSVKLQNVISRLFPESRASRCFGSLVKKICKSQDSVLTEKNSDSMWKHFHPEPV